jgi:hypothetical protein
MSAMTMIDEKHEATPDELNMRIHQLQQNIDELTLSIETSQQKQSELATEREVLLLPARVNKDVDAQKRLHTIDSELMRVRKDISDDGAAIADLSKQIASAKNALDLAEWEGKRSEIRKAIVAHLENKSAAKLDKAVESLAKALKAAELEDDQLCSVLASFDPSLQSQVRDLRKLRDIREMVLGFKLREVLPIETNRFYSKGLEGMDAEWWDHNRYGNVLEVLNRMELVF